jgi:ribose-phosphate pyrophosphokinase
MNNFKIFDLNTASNQTSFLEKDLPVEAFFAETFSDGEHYIRFNESLCGDKVALILSTVTSDDWLRLFLAIETVVSAGTKHLTLVIPFMGYTRQDKISSVQQPASSFRGLAKLLEASGVNQIVTIDIHSDQIKEFFSTTQIHTISAHSILADRIRNLYEKRFQSEELVIVAPDEGSVSLANRYLNDLKSTEVSLATIIKKRNKANSIASMNLSGKVDGKVAIIVDDMADTCGTLVTAAALLKKSGAIAVYAAVTHSVLSGKALEKIAESNLEKLFVTDTVGLVPEHSKIETVSVLPLLVEQLSKLNN